jgi:hypothetical protein
MSTIPIIIGRAEIIDLPEQAVTGVAARVDTGAKTSAIWASDIHEEQGVLQFVLFNQTSAHHNGVIVKTSAFETRIVATSTGVAQERYAVKLLIKLRDKRIRATFTLADRSTQAYPMLIGRNVLRGKFVVDVKQGTPLLRAEAKRSKAIQRMLKKEDETP